MKNFDAISARLSPYNVDDNLIQVSCMDAKIDADADYDNENPLPVVMAVISVLRQLIVLSSESNGGYSLGYSPDELRRRIYSLAKDNDLVDIADEFDATPTIEFLEI